MRQYPTSSRSDNVDREERASESVVGVIASQRPDELTVTRFIAFLVRRTKRRDRGRALFLALTSCVCPSATCG
jgi:hypothetical protein